MEQHARPPTSTQLILPFDLPDAVIPSPLPLVDVTTRPRVLWRRLSPAQQRQVRQTLVRIWQEVLNADAQYH